MVNTSRRRFLATSAACAATALPWHADAAPGYPDKSVRVIVPFPAGGTTDVVARLALQKLGEITGQSFVVDNKGGPTVSLAPSWRPAPPPTAIPCC